MIEYARDLRQTDQQIYEVYFSTFLQHASERCIDYVGGEGAPHGQAASLESLQVFRGIIHRATYRWRMKPTILDAGAGASSVMLNYWFPGQVMSCDPDLDYIQSVARTVRAMRIGFMGAPSPWLERSFGFTFWDYGTRERGPLIPDVWAKTALGMYCDDCDTRADCAELRRLVQTFGAENAKHCLDCPEAIDRYGRWGIMLLRHERFDAGELESV